MNGPGYLVKESCWNLSVNAYCSQCTQCIFPDVWYSCCGMWRKTSALYSHQWVDVSTKRCRERQTAKPSTVVRILIEGSILLVDQLAGLCCVPMLSVCLPVNVKFHIFFLAKILWVVGMTLFYLDVHIHSEQEEMSIEAECTWKKSEYGGRGKIVTYLQVTTVLPPFQKLIYLPVLKILHHLLPIFFQPPVWSEMAPLLFNTAQFIQQVKRRHV